MKAISIHQPWAWAILYAGKPLENRSWSTNIRGRIAVHAAKTFDVDECEWIESIFGIAVPRDLPCGGIVGTVELTDVVQWDASRWFTGPYGWVLKHPQPCEFMPMPGK